MLFNVLLTASYQQTGKLRRGNDRAHSRQRLEMIAHVANLAISKEAELAEVFDVDVILEDLY